VLAHLRTLQTRADPTDRRAAKLALVKSLYSGGWSGDDIRRLFRFIDWIMGLPDELAKSFWQEFHEYEEEKRMPYITSVERIGMDKGMAIGEENGRREMLIEAIGLDAEYRFPDDSAKIIDSVRQVSDIDALRRALRAIKTAHTSNEFLASLTNVPPLQNGN